MTTTADVIRQQITPGVLMSLGAHKLGHYTDDHDQHALVFIARVLPFNASGERAHRPRIMRSSPTPQPILTRSPSTTAEARRQSAISRWPAFTPISYPQRCWLSIQTTTYSAPISATRTASPAKDRLSGAVPAPVVGAGPLLHPSSVSAQGG